MTQIDGIAAIDMFVTVAVSFRLLSVRMLILT
jgi:hypothetical protein